MATNSNSSQNTSDDNLPQKEFAFVQNESNKRELRSHAMREHWKNRRQTINEEKQKRQKRTQHTLLPTPKTQSTMSDENSESSSSVLNTNASSDTALIPNNERQSDLEGIPYQILSGVNLALGSSRLDPFDQLPMKLSVIHHKLLHHWFSAHAAMTFGPSPDGAFSPMRDVWLPLDLSNPASFNALMALSAAHLSRMQGFSQSEVALEFKSEAVRIVQLWMQDPERAVSDNVLAAILRLLTFERYWGTEAEWIIHHKGLMNLLEARGGIAALSSNWRLELTTFLTAHSYFGAPVTSHPKKGKRPTKASEPMATFVHPRHGHIPKEPFEDHRGALLGVSRSHLAIKGSAPRSRTRYWPSRALQRPRTHPTCLFAVHRRLLTKITI
ncbi:Heterokaryon incompatibility protein 6, OR allele [Fusarium oxysporum f. sp. albedinis]|nr:Heterokaryon incompatibility protein 6, OR allele [Fusarium oxysporum f. sp. albedinis]